MIRPEKPCPSVNPNLISFCCCLIIGRIFARHDLHVPFRLSCGHAGRVGLSSVGSMPIPSLQPLLLYEQTSADTFKRSSDPRLSHYLSSHAVDIGRPPTVKTAANICKRICYNNKDNLMVSARAGSIAAAFAERAESVRRADARKLAVARR